MGRADLTRSIQIGPETTIGTPVAATKKLGSTSLNMNIDATVKQYRAQGQKYDTSSNLQRLYGVGDYSGPLSFNELQYILSSLFGAATITTPATGTTSRQWLWTPSPSAIDVLKSFTVESGDSAAAEITAGVVARSLDVNFGSDEITVGGNLIGGAPADGTLTGALTTIAQIIASVKDANIYMGAVLGADNVTLLGSGNKVTDAIEAKFSIGDKVDPKFVLNSTYGTSFKDLIEKAPGLSGMFSTEHNAQSRTLYTAAVANAFRYVAFQVLGPLIETTINYRFELVMACNITPDKRTDAGGVYAYDYKLVPINDTTLTSAFQFRLVNIMTAL